MQNARTITLMTGRTNTEVEIDTIHYIQMKRNYADIHADWGEVIRARVTMTELENALGSSFIKVHRSCLVDAARIHHISNVIVLNSGEKITYAKRQKAAIVSRLCVLRGETPDCFVRSTPLPVGRRKTKPAPPTASMPETIPIAEQEEPIQKEAIQKKAIQKEAIQKEAIQKEAVQKKAIQKEAVQKKPIREENMLEEPLEEKCLPVTVMRRTRLIPVNKILYIYSKRGIAFIHTLDGEVCKTRTPVHLMEDTLGDDFIRTSRAYLVSVMSICGVTDAVHLRNGEAIPYQKNQKRKIRGMLSEKQKRFIERLSDDLTPKTEEAYREYYHGFEKMPVAFADIEMVFNEELRAVDWIFRYGNPALARLEKTPLKKLIGKSFGSVFPNMDSKWLVSYEQAVLYRKTLEIMDYSPEIDTDLKIICFPTFGGHCGCILFDLRRIQLSETSGLQQVLGYYQGMLSEQ